MTCYNLTICATDNGQRTTILDAGISADDGHALTVEAAYIQTDEHGTPSADAITALRCLAMLETIASHAAGISVTGPDAEIADLKAEIKRLNWILSQLNNVVAL